MLPIGRGAADGTPGAARTVTQESQRHQGHLPRVRPQRREAGAGSIVFIASDAAPGQIRQGISARAARQVTGQVISVRGGYTMP